VSGYTIIQAATTVGYILICACSNDSCSDSIRPENEVESLLARRRRGTGFQFLKLMKGDPIHDAELQPARKFGDPDGHTAETLMKYVQEQTIDLSWMQTSVKGGG
jgi:hypothetical protein